VFAFINKPLDRFIIREVAMRFRPRPVPDPRIAEAEKLMTDPDFFCNSTAPANLKFHGENAFSFQSAITTSADTNNTVFGHIFKAGSDWTGGTSVILLHGWNAEKAYDWMFPWVARKLNRIGINAVMIQLPYHGLRKPPKGDRVIRNFISSDLFHMMQATRQAVSDARGLVGWLTAQGSPKVGVWGISMGGWLAGLLACHDARIGFSVLQAPLVKLDTAVDSLAFCAPIRQGLAGRRMDGNRLNLACCRPLTTPDKTLLVECRDDQFIGVADVEELWRAWQEPVIWRVPYGHISVMLSNRVTEKIVGWIGTI
jgi:pimeloyl-ACP methyl ester carboxylesterase